MHCVLTWASFSACLCIQFYQPLASALNMYVPSSTNDPKEKLNSVSISPFEYFNRFDRFSTDTRLYTIL